MADIKAVQLKLESVVHFLRPLLPLANCHMVNFLNGSFWEKFIPPEIRNEYGNIGLPGVHKIFWSLLKAESNEMDPDTHSLYVNNPFIYNHFCTARKMCLVASPNIFLSHIQFQNKLKSWNCDYFKEFSVSGFMSAKKRHEVEMMSHVVAAISNATHSTHIIDVGSGRGYLSSVLALLHGQRVLGIDSSHINTHSAVKRSEKLQKYWPGMCKRADESSNSVIPEKRGKHWKSKVLNKSETGTGSNNSVKQIDDSLLSELKPLPSKESLYRQTTMYISENSDLRHIVRETFPEDALYSNLSLVGLHTCGNLAATCLKLFSNNDDIKAVCNVGCCYHLIEEKFCTNPFSFIEEGKENEFGFPMSQVLLSEKFSLGRNARMLAAQAIDRLSEKEEVSVNSLFFRALLQVILEEKVGEDRSDWQVGRIAAKCIDFKDYCYKSLKILKLDIQLTEEEISCFYDDYIEKKNELEAFFLFRVALAPVIETVILLDRLLYLLEKDFKEAHIVHLFDPVISPRCNALVAIKDLQSVLDRK